MRFDEGAEREEAAAVERTERQSFPYEGARGGAAASQGLSTRRPSAHQALSGGEPGDPASVPGRKTPQGDTGTPLRDGCTFVLGCPTGETVDNQGRARLTSLAAGAKAAAHEGAPQTTRKDEQIGAGERRVVPAGHGVETTVDVTMREREKAAAASAEGRQCEARPSRVQRVADFAAWATKVTEAVRAPPSGEPKRKRRGAHGRRDVDGAATGSVQGQGTTASLGEQRRRMERWVAHETQCGKPREW